MKILLSLALLFFMSSLALAQPGSCTNVPRMLNVDPGLWGLDATTDGVPIVWYDPANGTFGVDTMGADATPNSGTTEILGDDVGFLSMSFTSSAPLRALLDGTILNPSGGAVEWSRSHDGGTTMVTGVGAGADYLEVGCTPLFLFSPGLGPDDFGEVEMTINSGLGAASQAITGGVQAVPEPAGASLLVVGCGLMIFLRRKRQNVSKIDSYLSDVGQVSCQMESTMFRSLLAVISFLGAMWIPNVAFGQLAADDIPVAHTPTGGYGDIMPPPVLAGCTEPLVPEAPDLRGIWEIASHVDGTDHPNAGDLQRIEQCGDRIVITAAGVIHDSRADGTIENGVHDVAASDFTTPIHVVSSYEDFVHVLRPVGTPIEVTRMLDGDQLLWEHFATNARMDFVAPVPDYSQLDYHAGYWVTEVTAPGSPLPRQVINDTFFDPATNRMTVYAQSRIRNNVLAPVQVGPGECTQLLDGSTGCFHPDAVYLNGSGDELMAADGTGAWWVKHSWIVDGEGYVNHELGVAEEYTGIYVEGELLEDGLTVKIGPPEGGGFNLRKPLLDEVPIGYQVTRFEEVDQTLTPIFDLSWQCVEEVSAFNGQMHGCPAVVPEPSSSILGIAGMMLLAPFRRRRGTVAS